MPNIEIKFKCKGDRLKGESCHEIITVTQEVGIYNIETTIREDTINENTDFIETCDLGHTNIYYYKERIKS